MILKIGIKYLWIWIVVLQLKLIYSWYYKNNPQSETPN